MEQSPRVLVVDDEEQILRLCERTLADIGVVTTMVSDAGKAREALRKTRFDIVLTDVRMSESDSGVRLAEEIRTRWPETALIMMTGAPSLDSAVPSMRNGARDYLAKPFEPRTLQERIRLILAQRHLDMELDTVRLLRGELAAAYSELHKVERLKDALLSRVSHELRTPVAVASMAAELLSGQVPGSDAERILDCLKTAVGRMRSTVEDLILHAQLSAGNLRLAKSPVDLGGLVAEVRQALEPILAQRGVSIEISSKGDPRPLEADPALLKTAVTHLLLNAARFNKTGGSVRVRVVYESAQTSLFVEDTGIGIPEGELSRIFDGFYQVADFMTRSTGGLGVGLAIVRRVAEAHGGGVRVKSSLEKGSEFCLWLPAPGLPQQKLNAGVER